jgi:mRNA interferase MazF
LELRNPGLRILPTVVHLKKGTANLNQACDIMIDQLRAIDNKRLTKRIGVLPTDLIELVAENIQIVLDLE